MYLQIDINLYYDTSKKIYYELEAATSPISLANHITCTCLELYPKPKYIDTKSGVFGIIIPTKLRVPLIHKSSISNSQELNNLATIISDHFETEFTTVKHALHDIVNEYTRGRYPEMGFHVHECE